MVGPDQGRRGEGGVLIVEGRWCTDELIQAAYTLKWGRTGCPETTKTAKQSCATSLKGEDPIYAVRGSLKLRTAHSVTSSMTA
jgi:hypothetical protein